MMMLKDLRSRFTCIPTKTLRDDIQLDGHGKLIIVFHSHPNNPTIDGLMATIMVSKFCDRNVILVPYLQSEDAFHRLKQSIDICGLKDTAIIYIACAPEFDKEVSYLQSIIDDVPVRVLYDHQPSKDSPIRRLEGSGQNFRCMIDERYGVAGLVDRELLTEIQQRDMDIYHDLLVLVNFSDGVYEGISGKMSGKDEALKIAKSAFEKAHENAPDEKTKTNYDHIMERNLALYYMLDKIMPVPSDWEFFYDKTSENDVFNNVFNKFNLQKEIYLRNANKVVSGSHEKAFTEEATSSYLDVMIDLETKLKSGVVLYGRRIGKNVAKVFFCYADVKCYGRSLEPYVQAKLKELDAQYAVLMNDPTTNKEGELSYCFSLRRDNTKPLECNARDLADYIKKVSGSKIGGGHPWASYVSLSVEQRRQFLDKEDLSSKLKSNLIIVFNSYPTKPCIDGLLSTVFATMSCNTNFALVPYTRSDQSFQSLMKTVENCGIESSSILYVDCAPDLEQEVEYLLSIIEKVPIQVLDNHPLQNETPMAKLEKKSNFRCTIDEKYCSSTLAFERLTVKQQREMSSYNNLRTLVHFSDYEAVDDELSGKPDASKIATSAFEQAGKNASEETKNKLQTIIDKDLALYYLLDKIMAVPEDWKFLYDESSNDVVCKEFSKQTEIFLKDTVSVVSGTHETAFSVEAITSYLAKIIELEENLDRGTLLSSREIIENIKSNVFVCYVDIMRYGRSLEPYVQAKLQELDAEYAVLMNDPTTNNEGELSYYFSLRRDNTRPLECNARDLADYIKRVSGARIGGGHPWASGVVLNSEQRCQFLDKEWASGIDLNSTQRSQFFQKEDVISPDVCVDSQDKE